MRPLVSVLATGLLALALAPVSAAGTGEGRQGESAELRRLTFSADCVQTSGRLSVRAVRDDTGGFDLTLRGRGLPRSLDWGSFDHVDGSGTFAKTFDPRGRRVHQRTTADSGFRGDVAGMVVDVDTDASCDVGAMVVAPETGTGSIRIGNDSVRLIASRHGVGVGGVPCRRSRPVRGRAVLTYAEETLRSPLEVGPCDDGEVTLAADHAHDAWPDAAEVVVRSAGRAWHAAYRLRFDAAVPDSDS